jgi:hypothetical protein
VSRRLLAVAAVVAASLISGCREAPRVAPKVEVPPVASDPRGEGDAAAQRGDWATAVARYRDALQVSPNDVILHFALGSAYSQLDRRADAIEEFSWVVRHGEPRRPEVATARQWLQQAAAMRSTDDTRPTTTDAPRERPTSSTPVADARVGAIEGRTEWPGLGPHEKRRLSVHLRLRGESETTTSINKRLNMEIGMPFELGRVPPGNYRLVGESKGITLWDVPLTVDVNKTTNVELSPANSTVRPGDFPPAG